MVVEPFLTGRNTGDNVRFGMAQNTAGPETFGDIELRPVFSCLLSKRDATCYFDQLAPPKRLRRFSGRPPIIEGDFTRTGNLPLIHLRRYLDTTGDLKPGTILYLVSCCWPAGNSRSSFVAQSVLLKCCLNAGLTRNIFCA